MHDKNLLIKAICLLNGLSIYRLSEDEFKRVATSTEFVDALYQKELGIQKYVQDSDFNVGAFAWPESTLDFWVRKYIKNSMGFSIAQARLQPEVLLRSFYLREVKHPGSLTDAECIEIDRGCDPNLLRRLKCAALHNRFFNMTMFDLHEKLHQFIPMR